MPPTLSNTVAIEYIDIKEIQLGIWRMVSKQRKLDVEPNHISPLSPFSVVTSVWGGKGPRDKIL